VYVSDVVLEYRPWPRGSLKTKYGVLGLEGSGLDLGVGLELTGIGLGVGISVLILTALTFLVFLSISCELKCHEFNLN